MKLGIVVATPSVAIGCTTYEDVFVIESCSEATDVGLGLPTA